MKKNKTHEVRIKKIESKIDKLVDDEPIEPGNWHALSIGDYDLSASLKANEYVKEYFSWIYANVTAVAEAVSGVAADVPTADGQHVLVHRDGQAAGHRLTERALGPLRLDGLTLDGDLDPLRDRDGLLADS